MENRVYPKGFVIGLLITLVIGLTAHAVIVHGFYIVTKSTCKLYDIRLPRADFQPLKIQPQDPPTDSPAVGSVQPWSTYWFGGMGSPLVEFSYEFAQNREALTLALTIDYLRQRHLDGEEIGSMNALIAQLLKILDSGEITPLEAAAITSLVDAEERAYYAPTMPPLSGIRANAGSLPVKDYALEILSRVDRDCYSVGVHTFPKGEHNRLLWCMIFASYGQ